MVTFILILLSVYLILFFAIWFFQQFLSKSDQGDRKIELLLDLILEDLILEEFLGFGRGFFTIPVKITEFIFKNLKSFFQNKFKN